MDESSVLIDPVQLGKILGVSRSKVYEMNSSGVLGPMPIKLGRSTRWRKSEVLAWIDSDPSCMPRTQWLRRRLTMKGGVRE
jgi:predicted DNA-binding transcriptional regulator AlpA